MSVVGGVRGMKRAAWLVLAVWIVANIDPVQASFKWQYGGVEHNQPLVQLWYEGYWKDVGWVNGTVEHYDEKSVDSDSVALYENKIVLVELPAPWKQEALLRRICELKPQAIILTYRGWSKKTPGLTMYTGTDGKERQTINVPVAEAAWNGRPDLKHLANGTYIEALWEPNLWMVKLDKYKYQTVVGALLSLWEALIIIFGVFRIYQFYCSDDSFHILSIGPLCLLLEVLSAAIRFSLTIGDPYFVNRVYPTRVVYGLMSIHVPITFASGILLSFFWAETLTKTRLTATPFISKYRGLCIAIVLFLVTLEAISTAFRCTTTGVAASSVVGICTLAYLIVTILLIISFSLCAYGIFKRIGANGTRKQDQVKAITLRFGVSIFGYVAFLAFFFGYSLRHGENVITFVMFDGFYASLNWIASMQVLALKPLHIRYSKSAKSTLTRTTSSQKSGDRVSSSQVSHTDDVDHNSDYVSSVTVTPATPVASASPNLGDSTTSSSDSDDSSVEIV